MWLLLDIGRTKFRMARSLDGETFVGEPEIIPTPATVEEGVERILNAVRQSEQPVKAVMIGASRRVWAGARIAELVKKELTLPIYIENDAALAGLGEATVGAGRGFKIVVYLTVSTGVGGVKIEDGRIDENTMGFEPGQQIITIDGEKLGHLEDYVSGLAVARRFGRPPPELTDEKIWQDLSRYLAVGLTNTILHWSPDCLILGGSMFQQPGFKIAILESLIRQDLTIFPKLPVIKEATLGEASALYGGLTYLRARGL
ncbi:MAG: ROK family protein [Candidatus Vogelbacteria bacterium]